MKRLGIIFLIIVLVCGVGYGVWWYFFNNTPEPETEPSSVVEEYPEGDTTAAHLAEVLGSESRYNELRNSKLRKIVYDQFGVEQPSMQIVYDTYYNPLGGKPQKTAWVSLGMRGEIVEIKPDERVIVIANEDEKISLYIPECAVIERGDGKLEDLKIEDLKIGDWPAFIFVVINADRAELRSIGFSDFPFR